MDDEIKVWVARRPDGTFALSDDDRDLCWERVFDRHAGQARHTCEAYRGLGWTVEQCVIATRSLEAGTFNEGIEAAILAVDEARTEALWIDSEDVFALKYKIKTAISELRRTP